MLWSSLVAQWVKHLALSFQWLGCCCGVGLTSGLGTSTSCRCSQKKKKKKCCHVKMSTVEKIKQTRVNFDLPRFSTRLICLISSKDTTSDFEDS